MEKQKEIKYNEDYFLLMDLAMESARKGNVDQAKLVIRYMMENWPERVIRYEDSVLAKELAPSPNQASNP